MPSSLGALLAEAAASLPDPTPAQRDILAKLAGTEARIVEGRLRVAVLGQFKRGKSTLLNALLGTPLLPTGTQRVYWSSHAGKAGVMILGGDKHGTRFQAHM